MPEIIVTEALRPRLRRALVDEAYLADCLRSASPRERTDEPGHYEADCELVLPRPLDPETAELRSVKLLLVPVEGGWEIYDVEGLEPEP